MHCTDVYLRRKSILWIPGFQHHVPLTVTILGEIRERVDLFGAKAMSFVFPMSLPLWGWGIQQISGVHYLLKHVWEDLLVVTRDYMLIRCITV